MSRLTSLQCSVALVFSAALTAGIPALGHAQEAAATPLTEPASSCIAPKVSANLPRNRHARFVTTNILPAFTGTSTKPTTLAERMRVLKVPGLSVAVIRAGNISWTHSWGIRDARTCAPVTPNTVFQAASISKPFAAVLAMRQVEQRNIQLDGDINFHLKRWKLTSDPNFPKDIATLRQLLSHTAGVGVPGFYGYSPREPIPSLTEILNGQSPANSPKVAFVARPGAETMYSGGGYQIVHAALEDSSAKSFSDMARREIFAPLGMTRSGFEQPPGARLLKNAASGHLKGDAFRDNYNVYPELAAAGLWSTPSDLARFLIEIRAASLKPGYIVSPATANLMLTAVKEDHGLGFSLWGTGENRRFGHNGANLGFISFSWINRASGDGIVVMTNGERGNVLADDVIRAVANDLGWTEFKSRPLMQALSETPVYLRGSMNGWSTSNLLRQTSPGKWSTTIEMQPGKYEFKLASEDWQRLVFSTNQPLTATSDTASLSSYSGNSMLSIVSPGRYTFMLEANETGLAGVSVSPE